MSTVFAAGDIVNITITISDVLSSSPDNIPKEIDIGHAHPNPFNNSTSISFEMPNSENVNLSIFDMSGRNVRKMNLGVLSNGVHKVLWDGKNNFGRKVPSGVYLYSIEAGDFNQTKKMLLLK